MVCMVPCLQDMLDIIDMEGVREPGKYPTKQGGFDLIWDGGAVPGFDQPTSLPSMLGCYNHHDLNQRRQSLAQLVAADAAPPRTKRGSSTSMPGALQLGAVLQAAAAVST